MGTWIGHVAPGIFFVIFAFWWHIHNCVRYFKSLKNFNEVKEFRGSTTYPCLCFPCQSWRRAPIESILKILITVIHFSIEIHDGYNRGPPVTIGDENAHHTAMLFGFFSWFLG